MKSTSRAILFGGILQLAFLFDHVRAQQAPDVPSAGAQKGQPAENTASIPLSAFSAVGSSLAVGSHLDKLGWNEEQIAAFVEGVRAALQGKPVPFDAAAQDANTSFSRQLGEIETQERGSEFARPGAIDKYLKDICKRLNLEQSDSGLCYGINFGAKGIRPGPDDTVVVSCMAIACDGKTELPQLSNQNARAKVSSLLPGFVEGFQMMTVGSEAIFVLPPALSFGDGPWPPFLARGEPLIFRIALKEVIGNGAAR
jgi:FKBP-type peptidyl-prolyl cis-trans isomerase FkpA